jgi:hypothetical protein
MNMRKAVHPSSGMFIKSTPLEGQAGKHLQTMLMVVAR